MRSEMGCRREVLHLAWIASVLLTVFSFSQTKAETFRLAGIKVTGLSRYEASQVVLASGLHPGQSISLQDIQAAAQKLGESGYFQSVKYQFSHNQGTMDLEFQVVEAKKFLPCTFDNFVWFTDKEILNSVRATIPMFDGSIPDLGTALEDLTHALEGLLATHKIFGTVTAALYAESLTAGKSSVFLIRASGVNVPIRKLEFPGSSNIPEATLQEFANTLLGQQYSRVFAREYSRTTLTQLYRQKGHLRIQFKEPEVRVEAASAAESAVTLILGTDEGLAYAWNQANWSGDLNFPTEDLDRVLGMKTGEVADGLRVDKGLELVTREQGRKGFLDAQVRATPEFDDPNRSVSLKIQVAAGPQYHMGSVTFKGVPEDVAKQLGSKWMLHSGDVFDTAYLNEFLTKDARDEVVKIHAKQVSSATAIDRAQRTVNVTIEFKGPQ